MSIGIFCGVRLRCVSSAGERGIARCIAARQGGRHGHGYMDGHVVVFSHARSSPFRRLTTTAMLEPNEAARDHFGSFLCQGAAPSSCDWLGG